MDIPYGFLTVDEAARELGVPRVLVVRLLEQDVLHGRKVGSTWRINPWSLIPLVQARAEEDSPERGEGDGISPRTEGR